VKALILPLEEDRDLTKRVSIVDLIDLEHSCTTSWVGACAKRILRRARRGEHERRRRQWLAADEGAAFEKELQFAHGEPQRRRRRRLTPQTREAAPLQALGIDAQPRAVPQEDLGPPARTIREDIEIAGQRTGPAASSPAWRHRALRRGSRSGPPAPAAGMWPSPPGRGRLSRPGARAARPGEPTAQASTERHRSPARSAAGQLPSRRAGGPPPRPRRGTPANTAPRCATGPA